MKFHNFNTLPGKIFKVLFAIILHLRIQICYQENLLSNYYVEKTHQVGITQLCFHPMEDLSEYFLQHTCYDQNPERETTTIYILPKNKTILMSCFTEGYYIRKCRWFQNDRLLEEWPTLWCSLVKKFETEDSLNSLNYTCSASYNGASRNKTFVIRTYDDKPILINSSPTNMTARIGQSINMTCEFSSTTQPWYTSWYTDAQRFKFNHEDFTCLNRRIHYTGDILKYTTVLELNDLKGSEDGSYKCEATNINGLTSETISLTVFDADGKLEKPILINATPDQNVEYGKSVGLRWEFSTKFTSPLCQYFNATSQKHMNAEANMSFPSNIMLTELPINDVKFQHSGLYCVHATNKVGTTEHCINLQVFQDPQVHACHCRQENSNNRSFDDIEIIIEVTNITTDCGNTIICECPGYARTDDRELPYWYHSSKSDILKIQNSNFLKLVKIGTRLNLKDLTTFDTGWYTLASLDENDSKIIMSIWLQVNCDKTNNTDVYILQKIQTGTGKPYLLNNDIEASCTENEVTEQWKGRRMLCLQCKFRGYHTPKITWHKENFSNSYHNQNILKLYNTSEIVTESNWNLEDGNYTCVANNTNGHTSRTIVVHVTEEKPNLINATTQKTLESGESDNLTCEFTSSSTPWYTIWRSNDNIFTLKRHHERPNTPQTTVLQLKNVTIKGAGVYTCIAHNLNGNSFHNIRVEVITDDKHAKISTNETHDGIFNSKIIAITLAVVLLFSTIVFLVVYRRIKTKQEEVIALGKLMKKITIEHVDQGNSSEPLKIPIVKIHRLKPSNDRNGMLSETEYEMPLHEKWEFPRENLRLQKLLGEGEFGQVMQAEANGILVENHTTTVAVKMLKDDHDDDDMRNLVSEMEIMKMLGNHRNILNLLACCSQRGPLFVITELAERGNLQNLLRQLPQKSNNAAERNLISYAIQIAEGMKYLASVKCVHRDLATRNILVTADYTMKIADFGLARNIRTTYYYKKKSDDKVPIKWMAPEAVFRNRYTTKSDVWSYGILLWEIETLGGIPYVTHTKMNDLLRDLRQGYRMRKPDDCSLEIYNVMLDCWKYEPTDRPDFSTIANRLNQWCANFEEDDRRDTSAMQETNDDGNREVVPLLG